MKVRLPLELYVLNGASGERHSVCGLQGQDLDKLLARDSIAELVSTVVVRVEAGEEEEDGEAF